MTITHHAPGVSSSLILRGRWSASVDEMDSNRGTMHADSEQLPSLIQVLRDHQRRHPAAGPRGLDGAVINGLLQAFEHEVETTGWSTCRLRHIFPFFCFNVHKITAEQRVHDAKFLLLLFQNLNRNTVSCHFTIL